MFRQTGWSFAAVAPSKPVPIKGRGIGTRLAASTPYSFGLTAPTSGLRGMLRAPASMAVPNSSPTSFNQGFYVVQSPYMAQNGLLPWNYDSDAMVFSTRLDIPSSVQYVNSLSLNPNLVLGPESDEMRNPGRQYSSINIQPGTYEIVLLVECWSTSPRPLTTPIRISLGVLDIEGIPGPTPMKQYGSRNSTLVTTEADLWCPEPQNEYDYNFRTTMQISACIVADDFPALNRESYICPIWFNLNISGSVSLDASGSPYIQCGIVNMRVQQIGSNAPGV